MCRKFKYFYCMYMVYLMSILLKVNICCNEFLCNDFDFIEIILL